MKWDISVFNWIKLKIEALISSFKPIDKKKNNNTRKEDKRKKKEKKRNVKKNVYPLGEC